MPEPAKSEWPVLRTYGPPCLDRIAMPLGGIGTGTISIGGRGDLRDWEVMNRPAKGFAPDCAFFAIRVRETGSGKTHARALEGPLPLWQYEGAIGAIAANHGLPRFEKAAFDAAYPLAQVRLTDSDVPVCVRIEAFNPFVPADSAVSGYPAAILRYVVTNLTDSPLDIAVCGSFRNFIGRDGNSGKESGNVNEFRDGQGLRGVMMTSSGVDPAAEQFGTMALATPDTDTTVTYRTNWIEGFWNPGLLDFWDDFTSDGALDERPPSGVDNPVASLCSSFHLPPRGSRSATFIIAWRFPNRMTWTPAPVEEHDGESCGCGSIGGCNSNPNIIGNYYATCFTDAWEAAAATAAALPDAEERTIRFVEAFCSSDLPAVVKEAALFNLSTLRSQTVFRTPDGRMFGWEGCSDHEGCCMGSCTHVWNYETAVGSLFGDLSRSMRDVEMQYMTAPSGLMSFRVSLPLSRATGFGVAAADGQMGALVRLHRDWKLCGDDEFLKKNWTGARRALEFCWIPGGWDADQDGVMEGCQHNTMDVEYYGPNGQMGFWYLCALRACEEMARHLGEAEFAARCRRLFESGGNWIDANLFNGEYYEHHVIPPGSRDAVAPGLIHNMGTADLKEPQLQLGAACLVDQLVGQYMASLTGLGLLADREHITAALKSIYRYNFKSSLRDHFNNMRSFALGDEAATLMATYPRGDRPRCPFPYFGEAMTGFEYTAAVGMLQAGMLEDGLILIQAIRNRYDGQKRNPFNEAECGHHYARGMASWSAVLALTGFDYDAASGTMVFNRAQSDCTWFWSTGNAWGVVHQNPIGESCAIQVRVLGGSTPLRRIGLRSGGVTTYEAFEAN